jgi:hypothetical protein
MLHHLRIRFVLPATIATLVLLPGCGGGDETAPEVKAGGSTGNETAATVVSDEQQAVPPADGVAASGSESAAVTEASTAAEGEEIDPDELEPSGTIELKQYTVAWVGSGTMGGGTLTVDGVEYPFRLAGLGFGGYGASSIDASGIVYNLSSVAAFPGTYGNARMGMTGGDSGTGKLWLRNEDGVVVKLESKMRGLALGTGVDGILIQWEDEEDSEVDEAMDGTRDTAGEAIEAGADAVQGGVDNVKGWFKKD